MSEHEKDTRSSATDPGEKDGAASSGAGTPAKRRSRRRLVIGVLLGAAAGFAYYAFIGCNSGGCPITSSPWISTLYGSALGGVVANI